MTAEWDQVEEGSREGEVEPLPEAAGEAPEAGPPGEGVQGGAPDGPEAAAPEPEELQEAGEPAPLPPLPLPEGMSSLDLIEALVFSASEALSTERLAQATGLPAAQVKEELAALAARLEEQGRPYRLQPIGRGWRLLTRGEFHPFIARLRGIKKQEGLSAAALETLAVVAYRQPIIRAEIEDIRGVQCGPMLRALLDRKLVRVAGRAQVPGRPLLYATTTTFLDRFGLKDLKDLPSLREFKEGGGPA